MVCFGRLGCLDGLGSFLVCLDGLGSFLVCLDDFGGRLVCFGGLDGGLVCFGGFGYFVGCLDGLGSFLVRFNGYDFGGISVCFGGLAAGWFASVAWSIVMLNDTQNLFVSFSIDAALRFDDNFEQRRLSGLVNTRL